MSAPAEAAGGGAIGASAIGVGVAVRHALSTPSNNREQGGDRFTEAVSVLPRSAEHSLHAGGVDSGAGLEGPELEQVADPTGEPQLRAGTGGPGSP